MAGENDNEGFVELDDLTKKQAVARAPLAEISFMPRAGERIFISAGGPKECESYTVVTVEYFLGYDRSTNEPARSLMLGMGRVTSAVPQSVS
jgi:hypothetical protein